MKSMDLIFMPKTCTMRRRSRQQGKKNGAFRFYPKMHQAFSVDL